MVTAIYFEDPASLRAWFERYHDAEQELILGYYKMASGKPSVSWSESVDQAICFGWIDGVRRSIDEQRYCIHFTPRRAGSIWSAVNIRKVRELKKQGLMTQSGLDAWAARSHERSVRYSYEQKNVQLSPAYEKKLRANAKAWAYFESLAPSYRKPSVWWVMSAKQEKTRLRRLDILIDCSSKGTKIPSLVRKKRT